MPFDAGVLCAIENEIKSFLPARVEKINQPARDEVVFLLHSPSRQGDEKGSKKLVINSNPNSSRFSPTNEQRENPKTPPMFCTLLRKHLLGSRLEAIEQLGFERAIMLSFTGRDEMGFATQRHLVAETMGKYSNIILLDGDKKVINALRLIEFSTQSKRPVLPGMVYEAPPKQDKDNPLEETREGFERKALKKSDLPSSKFLLSTYSGFSPLIAREIAYRACGNPEESVASAGITHLWQEFETIVSLLKERDFTPCLIRNEVGLPLEYSFTDIRQYGGMKKEFFPDFAFLTDTFYLDRERAERIKQKAGDLIKVIANAKGRLERKITALLEDEEACADSEKYKRLGDIITANMGLLKKGEEKALLTDYYSENLNKAEVILDKRLSPAENAQRYYKKYNKAKSTKIHAREQRINAGEELKYLETVEDALSRAQGEAEISEIREELAKCGYIRKNGEKNREKLKKTEPLRYRTTRGLMVLCGKNNYQNDILTFKTAQKNDIWFHVKNSPGSHVILLCGNTEPEDSDYTEAAMIAAFHSSLGAQMRVEVDYTRVKNLKKPPLSKPGYVIYHTNYSTYVSPDAAAVAKMKGGF